MTSHFKELQCVTFKKEFLCQEMKSCITGLWCSDKVPVICTLRCNLLQRLCCWWVYEAKVVKGTPRGDGHRQKNTLKTLLTHFEHLLFRTHSTCKTWNTATGAGGLISQGVWLTFIKESKLHEAVKRYPDVFSGLVIHFPEKKPDLLLGHLCSVHIIWLKSGSGNRKMIQSTRMCEKAQTSSYCCRGTWRTRVIKNLSKKPLGIRGVHQEGSAGPISPTMRAEKPPWWGKYNRYN